MFVVKRKYSGSDKNKLLAVFNSREEAMALVNAYKCARYSEDYSYNIQYRSEDE